MSKSNRRESLKTSAAVAGVAATVGGASAFVAGNETIKVGLIGCGGRGTGAVRDILNAEEKINGENPKIEIVAVADVFKHKAENAAKAFTSTNPKSNFKKYVKQIKITPDTI